MSSLLSMIKEKVVSSFTGFKTHDSALVNLKKYYATILEKIESYIKLATIKEDQILSEMD